MLSLWATFDAPIGDKIGIMTILGSQRLIVWWITLIFPGVWFSWINNERKVLAGLILGLCPANERRRYFVTTSLIG